MGSVTPRAGVGGAHPLRDSHPWLVSSPRLASSDSAPWVPASSRSSHATASTSSRSRSPTRRSRRAGRPAALDRPCRLPRQADGRGPGRAPRPGAVHERHGRPQGVPARRRGRARAPRPQEGHLRQARRDRLRRRDPRDQHELAARHRDRRRHDQPQARRRHALLQPGARAPVRRGHQDRHHERRDLRGRQGARRAARQEARHRRRQGRLHRQRPALRLPQPRRRDVREQVRHARGHRRRDEARLRLPHGPARPDGPHRPRHRLRDPRHDVQAGPRPPARAEPDHQADGQRRAQGPQERPRLLHVCRRPAARRSSTTR